jgi:hypothetical protein
MKFQTGPIPVRKILGPYWTKPGPVQSRLVHPRTGENTGCTPHYIALVVAWSVIASAAATFGVVAALVFHVASSTAELTPTVRARIREKLDLVTHIRHLDAVLD